MSEQKPLSLFQQVTREISKQNFPPAIAKLLVQRDGAAKLTEELPHMYSRAQIVSDENARRNWELAGLFYLYQERFFEALPIFFQLYHHMLSAQEEMKQWVHKGMPLVWIRDCYWNMGFANLAKRCIMLTLCEDAIASKGDISPVSTGVYFRAVWQQGLSDAEFRGYATKAYEVYSSAPNESLYPEWVLQELDQNWLLEFPTAKEASVYNVNIHYITHLFSKMGDTSGKNLERLADYLLSCMPGCRTKRRQRSGSTDYDVVCSMEGFEVDFRSELGRYFVCECKDRSKAADFTAMAKFCRVLDSTKARFGMIFSSHGITGKRKTKDATREQLKVYQDRGMVIIVVDKDDIRRIIEGCNFISMIRDKYEQIRLDLVK